MASVKEEKTNLLWKPKADQVTKMDEFRNIVNVDFGLKLSKWNACLIFQYLKYACKYCICEKSENDGFS